MPQNYANFVQAYTINHRSISTVDSEGSYPGFAYKIDHRDGNSVLSLALDTGVEARAKPSSMVAMSANMQVTGKFKLGPLKLFGNSSFAETLFTGPGEVLLAPPLWGDIVALPLAGGAWTLTVDAFLASAGAVSRAAKSQGLAKGIFSGAGVSAAQASGHGVLFVSAVGAVVECTLGPGEEWVVGSGHLVAWNCEYTAERIKGGGTLCRFRGPGTVYVQTRSAEAVTEWITRQLPLSQA